MLFAGKMPLGVGGTRIASNIVEVQVGMLSTRKEAESLKTSARGHTMKTAIVLIQRLSILSSPIFSSISHYYCCDGGSCPPCGTLRTFR